MLLRILVEIDSEIRKLLAFNLFESDCLRGSPALNFSLLLFNGVNLVGIKVNTLKSRLEDSCVFLVLADCLKHPVQFDQTYIFFQFVKTLPCPDLDEHLSL